MPLTDADMNEDWPKLGTWDLPDDVDRLVQIFGSLAAVRNLPAWESAPKSVRDEVERRLADGEA